MTCEVRQRWCARRRRVPIAFLPDKLRPCSCCSGGATARRIGSPRRGRPRARRCRHVARRRLPGLPRCRGDGCQWRPGAGAAVAGAESSGGKVILNNLHARTPISVISKIGFPDLVRCGPLRPDLDASNHGYSWTKVVQSDRPCGLYTIEIPSTVCPFTACPLCPSKSPTMIERRVDDVLCWVSRPRRAFDRHCRRDVHTLTS